MMYEPAPRLGRLHSVDINDERYLLRSLNPQAAVEARNVPYRYHFHETVLDQGNSSACTGAAAWQWLDMGPVRNLNKPDFVTLYRANQENDEWVGGEPAYYGSSVRASFKVMKKLGFVKTYAWAFDLETLVNHVLAEGPAILGTDYYTDMFRTDKDGFVHVGGRLAGGHAYAVKGASRVKKCPDGSLGAFRCINSWGEDFGQKGMFWLSFKDAEALIKAQGEAATAFEQKAA